MTDRIYVTYTTTVVPENYHAAIHYERTDANGHVVEHLIIEARPSKIDELQFQEKVLGLIEEAFREDNGASRFGTLAARVRTPTSNDDPNAPYETIAEGADLSSNL